MPTKKMRTADIFPVGGREARTGNPSAVCRLQDNQLLVAPGGSIPYMFPLVPLLFPDPYSLCIVSLNLFRNVLFLSLIFNFDHK